MRHANDDVSVNEVVSDAEESSNLKIIRGQDERFEAELELLDCSFRLFDSRERERER
jgi:hypothetical protein